MRLLLLLNAGGFTFSEQTPDSRHAIFKLNSYTFIIHNCFFFFFLYSIVLYTCSCMAVRPCTSHVAILPPAVLPGPRHPCVPEIYRGCVAGTGGSSRCGQVRGLRARAAGGSVARDGGREGGLHRPHRSGGPTRLPSRQALYESIGTHRVWCAARCCRSHPLPCVPCRSTAWPMPGLETVRVDGK